MFKAAIFDLDGTIIDSYELILDAFIETLSGQMGKEYTTDEIYALFGPPEEEIFKKLDPDNQHNLMEVYTEIYNDRHLDYVQLYPGIEELLQWLKKKNIARAIITGKGYQTTSITLKQLGIDKQFQSVVTGSCVKEYKPAPEGMLKVLDCLKVQPSEAFYLGDSPIDIILAKAAGVTPLAALWGGHDPGALLDLDPHRAFTSPEELVQWLEEQE